MSAADADRQRLTFGGELWTDANGKAMVELAPYLRDRALSYRYQIRPLSRVADVTVAAKLADGRLLITSNAPHLKVAWQVTTCPRRHGRGAGRREQRHPGNASHKEEKQ